MSDTPNAKTETLPSIRIEPDLKRYARERAKRERRSLANLVCFLLEQAREADQNRQPAA